MKKLYIASKNPTKIKSVELVFGNTYDVIGYLAPSGVSDQPMSDLETKQGAINRAKYLVKETSADVTIGLEGGVMTLDDQLFLCNWGALATKQGHLLMASGARIPLPNSVREMINEGKELGDVMDLWTEKNNVRSKEGAIGIFTAGQVDRTTMFSQINILLLGQFNRVE
ncbi:DUF84 family protein [Salipaludibacillus sp. HK11]|uniref:DUF84 family protein n=1 Tax=Salipaludibacillus sp. HK11 TaxID=3394320 RepID=UPI0039FC73C5